MIDINLIRENPEEMKKKLAKKLVDVDFTELLEKDKERKELLYKTDSSFSLCLAMSPMVNNPSFSRRFEIPLPTRQKSLSGVWHHSCSLYVCSSSSAILTPLLSESTCFATISMATLAK